MRNEDGFSLIELLVVLGLLSIVGASILGVATTTLRAERTAEDLARNLDDTRIAVERVRDEVRGADGVCEDSDDQSMTVWTDRDANGTVDDGEVVTFELVEGDGERVLQREDDDGTRRVAGRLVDAEAFTYFGPERSSATPNLDCDTGASPGTSAVAIVDLFFEVDGGGVDSSGSLSVETTIVLRNAGLVSSGGGGSDPGLRIASLDVNDADDDGTYDVIAQLEGVDLTHPADEVSFEVRCGDEGAWADRTVMAHGDDDRYTEAWDSSACDEPDATVLVTARDGEEEATAQVLVELEDDEAEPPGLAVEIAEPVDGSTVEDEQPIDVTITGVPEEGTADVGVSVEDEDGEAAAFAESGSVDADGTWRAGTWETAGIDSGTYLITATVEAGEESADDSVSASVRPPPTPVDIYLDQAVVVDSDKEDRWKVSLEFIAVPQGLEPGDDDVGGVEVEVEASAKDHEGTYACTTGSDADTACDLLIPPEDESYLKKNEELILGFEVLSIPEGYELSGEMESSRTIEGTTESSVDQLTTTAE